MTITELANAMVMERNGLGHNLQPLERDGLVRMEIGRDRRSRIIVVTKMGRRRLAEAKPLWRRAQKRFATAFEPEEIRALRALLTTAVAADYGDTTSKGEVMRLAETLHSQRTRRWRRIADRPLGKVVLAG
jgi:hypothetical protein